MTKLTFPHDDVSKSIGSTKVADRLTWLRDEFQKMIDGGEGARALSNIRTQELWFAGLELDMRMGGAHEKRAAEVLSKIEADVFDVIAAKDILSGWQAAIRGN